MSVAISKTMIQTIILITAVLLTSNKGYGTLTTKLRNYGNADVPYGWAAPFVRFEGPYIQFTFATTGDRVISVRYCTGSADGSFSLATVRPWVRLAKAVSGCGIDTYRLKTAGTMTPEDVGDVVILLKGKGGGTPNKTWVADALAWAVGHPKPIPDILPTDDFDAQWPVGREMGVQVNGSTYNDTPTAPGSSVAVSLDVLEGTLRKNTDGYRTGISMETQTIWLDNNID
ncbi:hypothetical protein DNM18_26750 [Salmonella enterica subsp. enterica]|nr:hypothetical protein [Salmonella enterica subsp. enterica serovar Poona]